MTSRPRTVIVSICSSVISAERSEVIVSTTRCSVAVTCTTSVSPASPSSTTPIDICWFVASRPFVGWNATATDVQAEPARPEGVVGIAGVEPQHVVVAALRVDLLEQPLEVVGVDDGQSAGQLGQRPQTVPRLADVLHPGLGRHVEVEVGGREQPPRVDGVERGVRPVGGLRQLDELRDEIAVGEHRPLRLHPGDRVAYLVGDAGLYRPVPKGEAVLRRPAEPVRDGQTLQGEGVQIVPGADVDEHLAAVHDRFETRQDVVDRLERLVRAPAHLLRSLVSGLHVVDQLAGSEPVAQDRVGGLGQSRTVVGQVHRHLARPVRDHPEQIALVNQRVRDRTNDAPDLRCGAGLQVELVDEQDDDPPGQRRCRLRRREDDPLRNRAGGDELVEHPAAVHQHERGHLLPNPVLLDDEVVRPEIGNERAVRVADDHVRADQGGARPEVGGGPVVNRPRRLRVQTEGRPDARRDRAGHPRDQSRNHGARPPSLQRYGQETARPGPPRKARDGRSRGTTSSTASTSGASVRARSGSAAPRRPTCSWSTPPRTRRRCWSRCRSRSAGGAPCRPR